jgi:transcriptional antiterminator NusG
MKMVFQRGDRVRIVGGEWAEFLGTVEDVDAARRRLRVRVAVFGREQRAELTFQQVEKQTPGAGER